MVGHLSFRLPMLRRTTHGLQDHPALLASSCRSGIVAYERFRAGDIRPDLCNSTLIQGSLSLQQTLWFHCQSRFLLRRGLGYRDGSWRKPSLEASGVLIVELLRGLSSMRYIRLG